MNGKILRFFEENRVNIVVLGLNKQNPYQIPEKRYGYKIFKPKYSQNSRKQGKTEEMVHIYTSEE